MRTNLHPSGIVVALALGGMAAAALGGADAPLGNAFMYQGRLKSGGVVVNGLADMRFKLYDGAVLLGTRTFDGIGANPPPVSIVAGLFTVELDYGAAVYALGDALSLEIDVRHPSGVGAYVTLTPRQPLDPAPFAVYAKYVPYSGVLSAPSCLPVCLPFSGSANVAASNFLFSATNTGTGFGAFFKSTGDSYAGHFQSQGDTSTSPNNPALFAENAGASGFNYGLIATGRTGGIGAIAREPNSYGIWSQVLSSATTSVALRAQNQQSGSLADLGTDTYAGKFTGDTLTSGTISHNYTAGTNDPAMPIAYGYVNSSGTIASGTPNFTATWNAGSSRYEIAITGESYFFSDYVTVVTPLGASQWMRTTSVSGNLLVYVYNSAGTAIQGSFQFVTFKPNPGTDADGLFVVPVHNYKDDTEWAEATGFERATRRVPQAEPVGNPAAAPFKSPN